jgi:amino acid transporter
MIGGRRPLSGRKIGDRRVRVERPHSAYFRYTGPGQLTAKPAASVPKTGLGRAWARIKAIAIGRPLASEEEIGERLSKTKALAVFSSDAISSSAYASEEILRILVLAGGAAVVWSVPIALSIAALLVIVTTSYRQVCHAYPSGGGAYAVARANLGVPVALLAAAALLFDYVMTVAVSIAAGIAAITSVVPELLPYRAELAIAATILLAVANLRGLRESGNIFAIPTYAYVLGALTLIGIGVARILAGDPAATFPTPTVVPPEGGFEALSLILIVRAFAFGSVALSGTEAITNGVPAFKPPEARNAANTMTAMGFLLGTIFVGVSVLAFAFGIVPDPDEKVTLIAQVSQQIFGNGLAFVAFQAVTTLILVLAANTGFNGAPRLARILAVDGFMPRQFAIVGDRLAFSWGIGILTAFACLLIWLFDASVASLIPLYSIGIFLSFAISQSGMVRHWYEERGGGWQWKLGLNLVGAVVTGMVFVVSAASKIPNGAWIVLITVPIIVGLMEWVRARYRDQERELRVAEEVAITAPGGPRRVVVPVNGINRAVVQAINVGRAITGDLRAVYITDDPEAGERLRERWTRQLQDVPFVVVESPYRALVGPLNAYLDVLDHTWPPDLEPPTTVVVLPEYVARHWWDRLLYNQGSRRLRTSLVGRERTVILDVPYRRSDGAPKGGPFPGSGADASGPPGSAPGTPAAEGAPGPGASRSHRAG